MKRSTTFIALLLLISMSKYHHQYHQTNINMNFSLQSCRETVKINWMQSH